MENEYMLTTVDNPYNPFVQFDEWYAFDTLKGYNTMSYLARIAKTSMDLSDEQNNNAIEEAINEILFFNVLGIYQKVSKENFDQVKSQPLTEENVESLKIINEQD